VKFIVLKSVLKGLNEMLLCFVHSLSGWDTDLYGTCPQKFI